MTVYRSGARVTRVASLPPLDAAEPFVVAVSGLPLCLDDSSVRARVIGGSGASAAPRATDLRVTLSVERSAEDLPEADDSVLEAAVARVIEQKSLLEQIERELERLSQLELRARVADGESEVVPTSPLASRLELLELRKRRWRELHAELQAARAELEARQREVKKEKDRLERASSARAPRSDELRKCIVVTIAPGAPGEGKGSPGAKLALEYRVGGARWAPAYVANLEKDGSSATIGARAVVAQKTGEDWSGVTLTLVTAVADSVTALPVLHSLRIGRRQPAAPTGWRPAPIGTDLLFADYEQVFAAAPPSGEEQADYQRFGDEVDEEITAVGPGTYPPPPPGAMPPPMSAPMPAEVAMPEAAAAMMFGARAAPARAKTAPGLFARSASMLPIGGAGGAGLDSLADLDGDSFKDKKVAPSSISADEVLLDYGGLVMAGPEAPGRGRLVLEDPIIRYRAELVREHWIVSFDIRSALTEAAIAARSVDHLALPAGHVVPSPTDFDYSYFAESRIDLPSDGIFHSIALSSARGDCRLRYQAAPRESCDVFRIARLTNPLEAPLLAGPIDVSLGGEFLLSTQTEFTPPGGKIRIGLGVEQGVRLVRNTSFRDDSAGLLGGSRELHHQIRIEAQNHLPRAIELEVRERIPVTRDGEDEIKVEVGAVVPPWASFEPGDDEPSHAPLLGGHRWVERLEPAAKLELKASYSIRIASKHELVGGNRRES